MAKRRKDKAEYGGGSVYQEKDGSWRVAIRLEPNSKPIRRRAADRESAEALLADLRHKRDVGLNVQRGAEPLEEFTDYWFNEVYLQRGRQERSQKHTLDMLELYILPEIGRAPLESINHARLQQLLNDMRRRRGQKPLSAQTVRHVYSVLKQVFGKAQTMGLIEHDPTRNLELPEIKRAEKPALEPKQVRALLELLGTHPHALAYHLMATLGLRLGEALAVRRTDFNADFTELKVNQQLSYHTRTMGTPKRDSVRLLPVPPRLSRRCAERWREVARELEFKDGALMSPSERGTPLQPSNVEKLWHGYTSRRKVKGGKKKEYTYPGFSTRAGLPDGTTLHDLRRFLATTLEDLDVGQRTIGHILGHGAKNVTERYIRRNLPTMRRALEKLEAVIWAIDSQIDSQSHKKASDA